MKARTFAPRNMDIGAFIESGEPLAGSVSVTDLARVTAGLAQDVDHASLPAVSWSAQGRLVPQRVGGPQMWLDLQARSELALECQRCLHAVTVPVTVQCSIRFVKDEAAAAALDADSDDDVLALDRHFDLLELVEDELIMAQPIVPRHAQCPTDVASLMRDDDDVLPSEGGEQGAPTDETSNASGRPNPFAVLATLKKGGS